MKKPSIKTYTEARNLSEVARSLSEYANNIGSSITELNKTQIEQYLADKNFSENTVKVRRLQISKLISEVYPALGMNGETRDIPISELQKVLFKLVEGQSI